MSGNDNNALLLVHCDGTDTSTTFTDDSVGGSSHTLTANGNAQVDTAQSKFGGASLLLDGTGDYLSTGDSADWDFGTGDFTIDFWARANTIAVNEGLLSTRDQGVSGWSLGIDAGGVVRMSVDDGATFIVGSGDQSISTGQLDHVALVRKGTGSTDFNVAINGTFGNAPTTGNVTVNGGPTSMVIGRFFADTNLLYFDGHLDEIRISDVARWTADFTPPTAAYDADIIIDVPLGSFSLSGKVPTIGTSAIIESPAGTFSLAGQTPIFVHFLLKSYFITATADGYLSCDDNTYANARSGAGTLSSNTGSASAFFGQRNDLSPTYRVYESFITLPTSDIPSEAEIVSATFKAFSNGDDSTTDFIIEIRKADYGASLTTADWIDGADLGNNVLLATHDTSSGWTPLIQYSFSSESDIADNINLGTDTQVVIVSDRTRAGTTPTTTEFGRLRTLNHVIGPGLKLDIVAYVPTTEVVVPSEAFTLTGLTPAIGGGASAAPPVGSFVLSGGVPAVASGGSADVPTASFSLDGLIPAVGTSVDIAAPLQFYVLSGLAPGLVVGAPEISVPLKNFDLTPLVPESAGAELSVTVPLYSFDLIGLDPEVLSRAWTPETEGTGDWTVATEASPDWTVQGEAAEDWATVTKNTATWTDVEEDEADWS